MKSIFRLIRWKYSFFLFTFLFFFVWTFFVDGNSVISLVSLWNEKKEYDKGIEFYDEQLKVIEIEQAEVMGSDDALEKYGREKYLIKKEGETVFVVVDSEDKMLD